MNPYNTWVSFSEMSDKKIFTFFIILIFLDVPVGWREVNKLSAILISF